MTVHLPVLPPSLQGPREGWTPRESFSPSQLVLFGGEDGCARKWAFRYLFGVRDSKPTSSKVLGTLIHACLEHYLRGGTVYDLVAADGTLRIGAREAKELADFDREKLGELAGEAPRRALAGLPHLPRLNDPALEIVEVEQQIAIDTRRINGGIEPVTINGKRDLSVRRAGVWYLYDHKSTKGRRARGQPFDPWAYCQTPEGLRSDPQAVFYGLDLVHKHELAGVWSRWVYYLTDAKAHPDARAVDVELERGALERAAGEWLVVAVEMRKLVREAKARGLRLDDIPPPVTDTPCRAYGPPDRINCPYHVVNGGPCAPRGPLNYGALALESAKNQPKEIDMSLAEQLAATRDLAAGQPAGAAPSPSPAVQLPQAPPGYAWQLDPTGTQYVCVPAAAPVAPPPVAVAPAVAPPPVVPQSALVPPEAHAAPVVPPPAAAPAATTAPVPVPPPPSDEAAGKATGGRPPGSKNKPKAAAAPAELEAVIKVMQENSVRSVAFHADGTLAGVSF